jgi:LmbE family N-acetylglucosaminyl deacetylase
MRCLLVCGAHPDDETFFAGTMAKYVSEGIRVCILCGTRGERGNTAGLCSIDDLPKMREAELRSSMRVLGLAEEDVFFLPYEDQKLHLAPTPGVRREIVRIVRTVKPQVVVCFDPHGANGHTDHVAMSRFVSDSIPFAGDSRFQSEMDEPWQVLRLLWQPPHYPWKLPAGTAVHDCFGADFLIDTTEFASKKREAILEHKTQLPGLEYLFLRECNPALTLDQEVFRIAWGPRPSNPPSNHLFDGLPKS